MSDLFKNHIVGFRGGSSITHITDKITEHKDSTAEHAITCIYQLMHNAIVNTTTAKQWNNLFAAHALKNESMLAYQNMVI